MAEIEFDENGRDANGFKMCPVCRYPHEAEECGNPMCEANPSVSEATKQRWRKEREQRQAEENERARIREIRRRAFERRS